MNLVIALLAASPLTLEVLGDGLGKLSWVVEPGKLAFVSHVGVVSESGSASVSLKGQRFAIVDDSLMTVVVDDPIKARGGYPSFEEFKLPVTKLVPRESGSKVELVDRVLRIVQDEFGFSVEFVETGDRHPRLITNLRTMPALLAQTPEEPGIVERRLAFAIDIASSEDGSARVTTRALVQYRRRSEKRFREEGSEALVRGELDKLMAAFARPAR